MITSKSSLFFIGLNPRWQMYKFLPKGLNVMYSAAGFWDNNKERWRQGVKFKRFFGLRFLDCGGFTLLNQYIDYPCWLLNYNAGPIAIASFAAFAGAGLADTLTYWFLGSKARLIRINGSNVISAGVDSFVFITLAFGFPVLWNIIIGQFVAKVIGGFIWSIILRKLLNHE